MPRTDWLIEALHPHVNLDSGDEEEETFCAKMANDRKDEDRDSDGDMEGDPEGEWGLSCTKEMALFSLMKQTGCTIMQVNGQRKFGGPPLGWEGPPPPRGCEVFVGKLPRDVYEVQLLPLFESVGQVYELRLMLEFNGQNRGYAFVMFANRESAQRAIQTLDNHEIKPGKFIGVCVSLNNCRLFIGSIPKDKKREEIMAEMKEVMEGVVDVIVYPSSSDENRNRGFAFVEFESHKAAAIARRKLRSGAYKLWGNNIHVNWADPEKDVADEVRNLMLSTTEETLFHEFSSFKPGSVAFVRKLGNQAFVHYRHREDTIAALISMNGAKIDGATVEVRLSKPVGMRNRQGAGSGVCSKVDLENNARGGGAREGNGELHWNDEGMKGELEYGCSPPRRTSVPPQLVNPLYPGTAGGDLDRCVFPVFPGAPLSPTSLLSLKQSQISSAVSLLDFYCHSNCWSQPEYHLFSTPGKDGQLLLLYKVVIPATQSSYIPDKLCVLLDDAKELAAQTTLRNLELSFHSESSSDSQSSPSPPPARASSATTQGFLTGNGRAYTSCLPPSAPPPPPPFSASQTQRFFINSPSPFY
ncbi:probable RNA-binding protein 46 isoform X2 [Hippoglossus hippoglossus]|uniref:probable RNA-binding protein 46 isoform X2 n=2 Tax=Hippoglossus TaxID=8266 RepID=UPI00148E6CE5|nr:probable RNA-binding protein 46 isoform X2 [Hippoglossus hippoglossus]